MLCILVIFSAVFSSVISETPYVCNGTSTISAPANLSQVITYPNNWNISLPDLYYAPNQDCRWNVEVPQGYYAYLLIRGSVYAPSTVRVTYSNGNVEEVPKSAEAQSFFMLAPSFSIHLDAAVNGTLGFSISYEPIPAFNPVSYTLMPNADPIVLGAYNSTIFKSITNVSLITSDTVFPQFTSFLRCFVLFDGQDMNATLIGNLYQVLTSENQLVSPGKYLTVVNLLGEGGALGNIIMAQDYSNVNDFKQYKFATCISSPCSVGMNAAQGTSGVVSVGKASRYLTDISISSTSNLKIYYGGIRDTNLVYSYNSSSRPSAFPQKLNNYITTFVLDSHTGLLQLSFANVLVDWTSSFDGRQGFISSSALNELSPDQSVIETFSGGDNYNYTTRIINHGLNGNATLQITTYDASNNAIDDHIYTKDNLPPTISDVHPGKSLSVIYQASGQNTTGVLIDFSIAKVDSSATNCVLWLTFILSFMFL